MKCAVNGEWCWQETRLESRHSTDILGRFRADGKSEVQLNLAILTVRLLKEAKTILPIAWQILGNDCNSFPRRLNVRLNLEISTRS